MNTDFNHFFHCYNKKCITHKYKLMCATSPLICGHTCPLFWTTLYTQAVKRNHFSFVNTSLNKQCNLTKFSTLVVNEYVCLIWRQLF